MYEYIKGKIEDINPASVIIETNGIGWFVNISVNTFSKLNNQQEAKLFIHQTIRDDAHTLFGFSSQEERTLFRQLISVNGVGAATAMVMLSSHTHQELSSAIVAEEVNILKKVKGIGPKTAQRIIIDLKDKIEKSTPAEHIFAQLNNTIRNEALSALIMLGFAQKEVVKTVDKILATYPETSVEEVVKNSLKQL